MDNSLGLNALSIAPPPGERDSTSPQGQAADSKSNGVSRSPFATASYDHLSCNKHPELQLNHSNGTSISPGDRSLYSRNPGHASGQAYTPRHPAYQTQASREASYTGHEQDFPQHLTADMAKAGLFYQPENDVVHCFQCGHGVMNRETIENPWIEHVRQSAQCPFLEKEMGSDFIAVIERSYNDEAEYRSLYLPPDKDNPAHILKNYRQTRSYTTLSQLFPSELNDGRDKVAKVFIHWYFTIKKENQNQPEPSIMVDLMYIDNIDNIDNIDQLYTAYIQRCDEFKCRVQKKESLLKDQLEKYKKDRHSSLLQAEQQRKERKELEQKKQEMKSKALRKEQEIEVKELKKERVRHEKESLCILCEKNKKEILFVKCGHLKTCESCSDSLKHCPLENCHKEIGNNKEDKIKPIQC